MTKPAIKVEGLWKEYKVGHLWQSPTTFYDLLGAVIKSPFRALRGNVEDADKFWALRDVNFEVQQGEVVGVIGRNGAGKSTLLKIMSRITAPTKGRIETRGRLASLLEVGTGFHPELSGRENIYLNGAILGMTRREVARKFDEIVAFSEIEQFIDTPVKRYSSGMYVRLAFAVAAYLEPDILVVDEVLAVGDVAFQRKCLDKIQGVANTGRTVLFVSHNLGAISTLCSRAILLEKGVCSMDAGVETVVKKYLAMTAEHNRAKNYLLDQQKQVQLIHLSILNQNNEESYSCLHNESFSLLVEYQVSNWPIGAYVCIDVFSESGQRLIWSADVEKADEMIEKRKPGIYQTNIVIPSFILAPGRYYFTVAIYAPATGEVFDVADKAVSVEIFDGGSLLSSLGIQYDALTSIPLKWHTQKIPH